jgi:3-oxoacyl-[acyl-carrier protein] reductase
LSKNIDSYQEAFDLLFKSVVHTTSLVIPGMQKNKWGRIINVTSVSVKEPLNYLVLSNSIRSAVVAWAKSLSVDLGPDGITVNSILTGYFDTERIKELNKEKSKSLNISETEVLDKMKSLVPVSRLGRPEEYGYLISFLSSDNAAYINGASIPIDGGLLKSY